MPLKVYLDDCSNSELLAKLLRRAGHHVTRPTDKEVVLDGEDDDVQFEFAAMHQLVIITKNPSDFYKLHESNPSHAGILAIYLDNDPSRDMSDTEIVKAIQNLEDAEQKGGEPIAGRFHSLNDWRY